MTSLISPHDADADHIESPGPAPNDTVAPAPTIPSGSLEAIRALVLRAHPDVVPELVGGETVDALLASVEPAQAAHARLVATLQRSRAEPGPDTSTTPQVPAGGSAPLASDPERLPAAEKIRRGVLARRS